MATTPLIITRSDFAGRVELSNNMADAKINNRILEAQDFDLKELMGAAFYYSFVGDVVSTPNQLLLNGGEYIVNDITYNFSGITPVLVYYATSRLIKNLDLHFTPNAVMQKRNEYSDHLESKDLTWRANQFVNQALEYWRQCSDFLDNNKADYTLWKPNNACCSDDQQGRVAPKIRSVRGDDWDYNDTRFINNRY